MPNMDGKGPLEIGNLTRRGGRACANGGWQPLGLGLGRRCGRGLGLCRTMPQNTKELLIARESVLKAQLEQIEKQLMEL